MDFYYFGGNFDQHQLEELEENYFSGVLFTYNPLQGDFFTLMARHMDINKKIKYMIAIRPHTISPQYLCMVNQSLNSIMPDRLQINLIAGHIKPNEEDFGGILGEVNDRSSRPSRTNYLIAYIEMLKEMSTRMQIPDFYVSCTNEYLFDGAAKNDCKIILPYQEYKAGHFFNSDIPGKTRPSVKVDISNKKIMLNINPIIRDTQEEIDAMEKILHTKDTEYFTYAQFEEFIAKLESEGINELMMHGYPAKSVLQQMRVREKKNIIKYTKRYVESKL